MAQKTDTTAQDVAVYAAKDTIGETFKSTMILGGVGLFMSSVQNSLTKQNVGALGVFTKTGITAATFAAMGGAYSFVKTASANLREKDDTWNTTWGGLAAGTMLGIRARSTPAIFGYGAAVAVVLSVFTFTGGQFRGFPQDMSVDEVERREFIRKNRRRPIDEIVNELGEGRGIYAPGYEERRARRLKEKYDIDVPLPQKS